MIKENLLKDYDDHRGTLAETVTLLEGRLRALLEKAECKIHSVSGRLKSRASLRAKVSRPDRTYRELWDVTDVVALRVITYFEDSIDDVARLIEREFAIDLKHSANKLAFDDARQFGYRSLHYVCRLDRTPSPVGSLPEAFRFEVQIRTVLQHAWAEIEHDLGYKTPEGAPPAIRRRFSRIASLLEIADQEFVSIRRDLTRYEEKISSVGLDPSLPLALDQVTLRSLLERPEVAEMDRAVARKIGKDTSDSLFFPDYLLRALRAAGLRTPQEALDALAAWRDDVETLLPSYFKFAFETWQFDERSMENVPRGYSLLFVAHIAVLRSEGLFINKIRRVARYYAEADYPDNEELAVTVAHRLLSRLKEDGHPAVEGGPVGRPS